MEKFVDVIFVTFAVQTPLVMKKCLRIIQIRRTCERFDTKNGG